MISLADMQMHCEPDGLTLVWTDSRSLMDLSLLRLGSCRPTDVSPTEAVFSIEFGECQFRRTVGELYVLFVGGFCDYYMCKLFSLGLMKSPLVSLR